MRPATLRKPLFGKEVEIAVWGIDERLAEGLLEDAYDEGRRLEKIFNLFDEGSALSALNRKRRMDAPQELMAVLEAALGLCEKTGGRYDISLGRRFLARKRGNPLPNLSCSWKDIRVVGRSVELLHPDALVDLGSIAKGYMADRMAEVLRSGGVLSGLIDARGDIRAFGDEKVIGVQHPRSKGLICSIRLKDGGVATSGDYSQLTIQEPHILNSSDYVSVTAASGTLMEADGYATAIFVTPREGVGRLLDGTRIKAMCVRKDMGIDYYNGFEGCLA